MIYATGISFKENSVKDLKSIVRIKLESDSAGDWKIKKESGNEVIGGWYEKEKIHSWLVDNGKNGFVIKVKIEPYSKLEPVESNGVKYVRAAPDKTKENNLLKLKHYRD
ncbi:DUF3892 domain-containing protein [Staphylococcus aureus]|uniref:DUF3892 domain-containing protein n=1 Tax=Staphylococcus aureus TaxID=1280 RepID=UPI0021B14A61|nr:DUF3892 domain-containing protein [Staphylococcus aureus]MCT6680668.1 DUF3892 domain-containing protein [Staphylococcus aureus]